MFVCGMHIIYSFSHLIVDYLQGESPENIRKEETKLALKTKQTLKSENLWKTFQDKFGLKEITD